MDYVQLVTDNLTLAYGEEITVKNNSYQHNPKIKEKLDYFQQRGGGLHFNIKHNPRLHNESRTACERGNLYEERKYAPREHRSYLCNST